MGNRGRTKTCVFCKQGTSWSRDTIPNVGEVSVSSGGDDSTVETLFSKP